MVLNRFKTQLWQLFHLPTQELFPLNIFHYHSVRHPFADIYTNIIYGQLKTYRTYLGVDSKANTRWKINHSSCSCKVFHSLRTINESMGLSEIGKRTPSELPDSWKDGPHRLLQIRRDICNSFFFFDPSRLFEERLNGVVSRKVIYHYHSEELIESIHRAIIWCSFDPSTISCERKSKQKLNYNQTWQE